VSVVNNLIGTSGTIGGHGMFFTGLSIANEGDVFVTGNTVSSAGSTFGPSGAGVAIVDHSGDFTIDGNLIRNVNTAGVFLDLATGAGFITGNDIRNGGTGTGISKNNSTAGLTITNNYVNDFATGLFYGSGADVSNDLVFENHLANNGVGVDHQGAGVLNASGNYWGFTEDDAAFDSYFVNGGTTGLSNGVNVDATPFLISGVDANDDIAFHGDFSQLYVTALGQQVGSTGRVQEAVDLVVQGSGQSSIEIGAGTFVDTVTINRPDMDSLIVFGQGDATIIDGQNANQPVISVTGFIGNALGDLTLQDFRVTGTTGANADGIRVTGVNYVRVDGVTAENLGGAGIVFNGTAAAITSGEATNVTIDTVGGDGIRVLNATGIAIDGASACVCRPMAARARPAPPSGTPSSAMPARTASTSSPARASPPTSRSRASTPSAMHWPAPSTPCARKARAHPSPCRPRTARSTWCSTSTPPTPARTISCWAAGRWTTPSPMRATSNSAA
jgi:hypothetical protein